MGISEQIGNEKCRNINNLSNMTLMTDIDDQNGPILVTDGMVNLIYVVPRRIYVDQAFR